MDRSKTDSGWPTRLWLPLLLVALPAAAYSNALVGPFVLDDLPSIRDNLSLRAWPTALVTPLTSTTHGRPFLNLSFALNYHLSGDSVGSYHLVNLTIHILAGLVLFGVLRRTLRPFAGTAAATVAFFGALLWALHPLDTAAVTYVVQRAESLMGLFYLGTLYCFIRYVDPGDGASPARAPRRWAMLCIVSCGLGMATKEVMVSAPLVVLLYDRTFVSGSFRESLRRHRGLLLSLAATWSVLIALVISSAGRGGTAGFGTRVSPWDYALTQTHAVGHYLRLVVYPSPLVFYYGPSLTADPAQILPGALLIAALLAFTAWALGKAPVAGFLAAAFFLILAPSSSFMPVATETVAEHRMYLALIPLVAGVVCGLYRRFGAPIFAFFILIGVALGATTYARNEAYRTSLGLWQNTVAHDPSNPWARNNLGCEWDGVPGKTAAAVAQFEEALKLKPDQAEANYNLANDLRLMPGRTDEAIAHYEAALRAKPAFPAAHNNLGSLLIGVPGRFEDAVAHYQEALRLWPNYAEAHYDLGNAWAMIPARGSDAVREYQEALRLKPDYASAHNNLGKMLANDPDRTAEAVDQFQAAIRLDPNNAEAHYNLGSVWSEVPGRAAEAAGQFADALRLRPNYPEAHVNLGNLHARMPGQMDAAIAQYRAALALRPGDPEGNFNLALALLKSPGHAAEARVHLQSFLKSFPGDQRALQILNDLPPDP